MSQRKKTDQPRRGEGELMIGRFRIRWHSARVAFRRWSDARNLARRLGR